ncbi:GIP, partial [Symbiodinium sp. CCMP2456]
TIASLESKVIEAEAKAVLTADELRSAHEILEKLKSADKGLQEALASGDPIALQGALTEAEAAGLQGARRIEAETKLKELKEVQPAEVPSPETENGAKAP